MKRRLEEGLDEQEIRVEMDEKENQDQNAEGDFLKQLEAQEFINFEGRTNFHNLPKYNNL